MILGTLVKHLNVPDKNGDVYCRLINGKLNFKNIKQVRRQCLNCKMFAGTYQGQGVECVWKDTNAKAPVVLVTSAIN